MKKGLIIRDPWITMILSGLKIWEIRNSKTNIRGKIYLIKSKSGMIFGEVDLIDCIKINEDDYIKNRDKHNIPEDYKLPYSFDNMYAWVMCNPIIYDKPIPYEHKKGVVKWINL